jgi:Ca2+-transporting ATPase
MSRDRSDSWHAKAINEIVAHLETNATRGLSSPEAAERLAQDGPNELRKGESVSPLALLAGQFSNLVIWVLIGAALVSVILGETIDGIAIIAIVMLNALVGFFQEYRAERAAAALTRLTAPRAKVVRDGQATVIATTEVVRGDILLLEAGDLVAADARLIEAAAFRANEAPLTGESQPVEKQVGLCASDIAPAAGYPTARPELSQAHCPDRRSHRQRRAKCLCVRTLQRQRCGTS